MLPALALVLARLNSATSVGAKASSGKRPRIALVTDYHSDYWTLACQGAEQAAREEGIELIVKTPAPRTVAAQDRIVDDLLAQGVEGIAINPVDDNAQGFGLLTQVAPKTLLFSINSPAPQSRTAMIVEPDDGSMFRRHPMNFVMVGGDDIRAGWQAGQEVKRVLPRGGDIMVFVGKNGMEHGRIRGLEDALKGSRVRILGVRDDNSDRARARANVAQSLKQHPRLAGVVGLWSYNGPAMLGAVRDARKVGKVKIVAFDYEADTLDGVQSGAISATIVQQPALFGSQTVRTMAQVLAGQHHDMAEPKKIVVPALSIRQRDVPALRARLKKALGP